MSVSIRHRSSVANRDTVEAASILDCLNAVKRGFDAISTHEGGASSSSSMLMAGAPAFDPVVEIDDLREQRRTQGYQAEDGTNVMRGVDKDDLYNEEWLTQYMKSEKMLARNPFYRFAMFVASQTGRSTEEMLDQSQVQRETVARAQAAGARLEELRRKQRESDTTPTNVEFQQKSYEKARNEAQALRTALQDLSAARTCFQDRISDPDVQEKANAIRTRPTTIDLSGLFNFITRTSIINNGPAGYQNTHQRLRDTLITSFNLFAAGNPATPQIAQLKAEMPRSSNMALNLAVLRYSATRDDLLRHITEPSTRLFAADSIYGKEPFLYGDDLVTLSKLIFENGGIESILFRKISFLLYAHLNRMRKNGGFGDEFSVSRPREPPVVPAPRERGKPREINGRNVVFEIDDDELVGMIDSPQLYDKDRLAAAQRNLFENASVTETMALLDRLLDPMYRLLVPHLFYSESQDEFSVYAGTSIPGNTIRAVDPQDPNTVYPLLSLILYEAMVLIYTAAFSERQNLNRERLVRNLAEAADKVFTFTAAQESSFIRQALGRLIQASGVVDCVALYIFTRSTIGQPLDGIDKTREETLRAFLHDPSKEESAYAIFSSAFMSGLVDGAFAVNPLFVQKSHQRFQEIVETETDRVIDLVRNRDLVVLEQTAVREREVLEEQRRERARRLLEQKEHHEFHLKQILEENYVPTASTALSARNTGVLIFSHLLTGAINASYQDLVLYVPCVANSFGRPEALILSEDYWCPFASLVQARVRLTSVRHPVIYQAVIAERRSRIGVRSELDTVRQVAGSDRSIRHVSGKCTCLPQYGNGSATWQSSTNLIGHQSIF